MATKTVPAGRSLAEESAMALSVMCSSVSEIQQSRSSCVFTQGRAPPMKYSGRARLGVPPLVTRTQTSPMASSRHSLPIPELPQVGVDQLVEAGRFGLLLAEGGGPAGHLVVQRVGVLFRRFRADVSAGSEDVAVASDLVEPGGLSEAGDVRVFGRVGIAAPGVVGAGDLGDVGVGQFAVSSIGHRAELSGVDEERLAASVAEAAVALVAGEKGKPRPRPQAACPTGRR